MSQDQFRRIAIQIDGFCDFAEWLLLACSALIDTCEIG